MNIAVSVAKDYKDWETFQSIMDSFLELHDMKFLVTANPHPLISLYCKIDIVPCYVNSLREREKYDMGLVFSTAKNLMSDECEVMGHKPYYIYHTDKDEFSYIQSLGTT